MSTELAQQLSQQYAQTAQTPEAPGSSKTMISSLLAVTVTLVVGWLAINFFSKFSLKR